MKTLQPQGPARADAHGMTIALHGGARLQLEILEPALARVRLQPADGYREPRTWAIAPQAGQDVPWQGRERDDRSGFACQQAQLQHHDDGAVTLRTDALSVTLGAGALALRWSDAQGRPLLADRASAAYMHSHRLGAVRHYLQREPGDRYYGLGDKTGPLDLHGRRLRTLAMDALGYDPRSGDPLYKHWPFVLSRSSQGAWCGLYYDTLAACSFDLGCEHDNYHGLYRHVEIDDGDLDYYVIAGNTPAEVIARFVALIGGTALPPRWSLGYAQTAMGLADAPDAQQQLDGFIERIEHERIPCSAFHYGSGYSSRGKRRYVFTWNTTKFPQPKTLNARFHASGMQVVANIKPCLLDDHPAFAQVQSSGGFIHDAQGQPVLEPFWDGMGAHLDFTHAPTIAWWQQQLRQQVLDYGIDAGWNDNNEYAILDDDARCDGFGQPIPMHRARPLHGLLMTRASVEAQRQHAPDATPFSVSRAGPPGIQRYAQTWSGDNTTSWHSLRWNIRTGLQMSLSGLFNVGHDVGGFAGPSPDAELFLRWVQACCLNPRMVMNSWKADGTNNVPWLHPQVTEHVAAAIRLRYSLMPYLWSLFERASRHHEPIIRPTFYDFPDDDACFADSDDFMLGRELLVAPVVEPGATLRRVHLPAGPQAWFDFHTGERFAAGQVHTVAVSWASLPLFARDGASIAMAGAGAGIQRHDDPVRDTRLFRA
ncbi:MAG: glycoside hydrolase family 31 protein [Burkholderiaceae bacterium]|nr:glycoside hydrolase family 31 protein [Rhodoferax sp.]MCB2007891.1 glycoside hydrolase family 31 protein [Rhodoferax sp.]MCB2039557.1 glycoside hydrolase family 31 protein [Rhodoferax sp.]MCP5264064.1 glycoside hydrolase family 31 protein [Rhodoferax sp.]